MANPAAILQILVTTNSGPAVRGLARVNAHLGQTESRADNASKALAKVGKVAAVGAAVGLGYVIKKAADFESQLDSLGAVTKANGRQMELFRKQAMKAGADTKFSALEAAVAQTELAKGGLSVAQIMRGGLRSALALAAAGELELGDAATYTVNAMKLFGLRGKDSMRVADAFATAANATTADVKDFGMALMQGGTAAKSAGLSFTETVATLEALAAIGIKNTDAGTSLKTTFAQLATPTIKAAGLMDKLNLQFFDAQGNMRPIVEIAGMLQERFGKLTREQQLQTAATLAGTDGMRTLLALADAGPNKLRKYEQGLQKSGSAAEVAAKKQDNFKGKLENLQGSIETIAIAIGSKMLPTLTKAAEKITDILNDPKLTSTEKLQQISEMFGKALSDAVPIVAKVAAKMGVAAAQGFVTGWRQFSPLAKILTAAALIRLVGGPGALMAAGSRMGSLLGAGVATGAATTAATGGGAAAGGGMIASMTSKVLPVAKRLGMVGVGIALADALISEMGRRVQEKSPDIFKELQAKGQKGPPLKFGSFLGPTGEQIDKIFTPDTAGRAKDLAAQLRAVQRAADGIDPQQARALRNALDSLGDVAPTARHQFEQIVGGAEDLGKKLRWLRERFADLWTNAAPSVKNLRTQVNYNMKLIADTMGRQSKRGRLAMFDNFQAAAKNVELMMKAGTVSTKRGLALIESYMVQALQQLGFSKADAIALRQRGPGSTQAPKGGELRPNQRGGPMFGGKPSGDSIPSLLERGEYVLNRNAVRKIGQRNLDAINFGVAPRFQRGGQAGIPAVSLSGPDSPLKSDAQRALDIDRAAARQMLKRAGGGPKVRRMIDFAMKIASKGYPYVYGGGHNAGFTPPYDCSGFVSAILHAAGLLGAPMTTDGLKTFGEEGPGSQVTIGVRGSTGRAAHTMMRIGKYFFESGSGHGAARTGGWSGAFDIYRHPKGLQRGGSAARAAKKIDPNSPLFDPRSPLFVGWGLQRGGSVTLGHHNRAGGWPNKRKLSRLEMMMLWVAAGGLPSRAGKMADIAWSESGWKPWATNPKDGGKGLWQITPAQPGSGDSWTNAKQAIAKMANAVRAGWSPFQPWDASKSVWSIRSNAPGAGGGLPENWQRILHGKGGKAAKPIKINKQAVHRSKLKLLDKIAGIGLPDKLRGRLASLTTDADKYSEFANRAQALTVTDEDGNVTPGVVGGLSEIAWAMKQLQALFQLRNALIRAEAIVANYRERLSEAIAREKATLASINQALKKKGLSRKQRRALLIQRVSQHKLIDALGNRRQKVNQGRGDILDQLQTVQGYASMKQLKTLPAAGVLGGEIFDVQMRLRDLNAPKTQVSDSAAQVPESADTSELTALVQDQLRQSNVRYAVSQAQYQVLKRFPYVGSFAQGGVVPGPIGQPGVAVVHGGEAIGQPGDVHVELHFASGMDWLRDFVRVEVNGQTRASAARGQRASGLAGRSGSLR